jgi:hypothetical protein
MRMDTDSGAKTCLFAETSQYEAQVASASPRKGQTAKSRDRDVKRVPCHPAHIERLEEFRRIYKEAYGEEPLPENEVSSPSPPAPAPSAHGEV